MNHALTMPRKFQRGFTLVELLASMILFSMIIGLTAWAVIGATDTTAGAEKRMDTASQARAFFDRFGTDLNTMMAEGGLTALYYSDASDAAGNSAIGFVCRSRPRTVSIVPPTPNYRGAVVGYRLRETKDMDGLPYPMLYRGDDDFLYDSSMKSIMENVSLDLLDGGIPVKHTFDWQAMGTGILRLHISFLLNTGAITQTPPAYKTTATIFPDGVITGSCEFIPFRAEDSDAPKREYVVGLIASVAVLDTRTRDLAFKIDDTFPGKFERPPVSGTDSDKTAIAVWNKKLETLGDSQISKPVRANIRFYERMYTVR